jgi:hypothetical protein
MERRILMNKRSALIFSMFVAITLFFTAMGSAQVHDAAIGLKKGVERNDVNKLQKDLKTSGALSVNTTGKNGNMTDASTKTEATIPQTKTQITKAATTTAIAEAPTIKTKTTATKTKAPTIKTKTIATKTKAPATKTKAVTTNKKTAAMTRLATVSRAKTDVKYLIPWFGQAEKIFARGDTAKVYDIKTGLSFNIKRTYGYNHADCETLTKADTEIMKKIYGGQWSWARRPVIVIVDGRKIAASMAGMPHAGLDNKPANQTVTGRSEGYGTGTNLDTVKGNNMDGHFDIHFLGSRSHGTNSVNAVHQETIKEAAIWAEKNY